MKTTATVLAVHRGYHVTDEPYGSEPFTIYTPEGRVLDHCDEETVKDCCDTIDIIEDERHTNMAEHFPCRMEESVRNRRIENR